MENFVFRRWNKGKTFFLSDVIQSDKYFRTHEFAAYICERANSEKTFVVFSAGGRVEHFNEFPFAVEGYLDNGQTTQFTGIFYVMAIICGIGDTFRQVIPSGMCEFYTRRYPICMLCR